MTDHQVVNYAAWCMLVWGVLGLVHMWMRGSAAKAAALDAKAKYLTKQKEFRPVLTITITEDGTLEYIASDAADVLLELGETVTRRASHVEPATFWTRVWFHIVRRFVTDKSAIAAWTRTWTCEWRVNTAPVGGPILTWHDVQGDRCRPENWERVMTWRNRQDAIDAEILFLNDWFLSR